MRKRIIFCNECHKPLTPKELKDYPIQWQYSGDMYCSRHKKRPWEKSLDLRRFNG